MLNITISGKCYKADSIELLVTKLHKCRNFLPADVPNTIVFDDSYQTTHHIIEITNHVINVRTHCFKLRNVYDHNVFFDTISDVLVYFKENEDIVSPIVYKLIDDQFAEFGHVVAIETKNYDAPFFYPPSIDGVAFYQYKTFVVKHYTPDGVFYFTNSPKHLWSLNPNIATKFTDTSIATIVVKSFDTDIKFSIVSNTI